MGGGKKNRRKQQNNNTKTKKPKEDEKKANWKPMGKRKLRKQGGVVRAMAIRSVGEFVVKEWQRLPRKLLHEHSQRTKQPKPYYPRARCDEPGKFRHRVVIPHGKNKDKDISLVYEQSFETQQLAQEMAALLGLFHLEPTLPLERKVPEPFSSTWLAMQKGGDDVPLTQRKFTVATRLERKEKEIKKRERKNQREMKIEMSKKRYATVNMSEANRTYIQSIIKSLSESQLSSDSSSASSSPSSSSSSSFQRINPKLRRKIEQDLKALEFAPPDISKALTALTSTLAQTQVDDNDYKLNVGSSHAHSPAYNAALDSCVDWLCLHVPEFRLPKRFDPRGGQFEVVIAGEGAIITELEHFLGIGRMGIPRHVVNRFKTCSSSSPSLSSSSLVSAESARWEDRTLALFQTIYQDIARTTGQKPTDLPLDAEILKGCREEVKDELLALESIYGEEKFSKIDSLQQVGIVSVPITSTSPPPSSPAGSDDGDPAATPVWFSVRLEEVSGRLEVLIPPSCSYPLEMPVIILRHDQLNGQDRLHMLQNIVSHVYSENLLGDPFIYELSSWLSSNWNKLLKKHHADHPLVWLKQIRSPSSSSSSSSSSASNSGDQKQTEQSKKRNDYRNSKSKKNGKKRRNNAPKLRNDPQLNEELKKLEAEKQESKDYQSMLKVRQNLPAYLEKKTIVDSCNSNQVVVISGATGCGKSTQIPQLLLEDAINSGRGSTCRIICTQPRRISALGLAGRVAEERAEQCGQSVGYRIRMDSKTSNRTRITYVTVGILLRQLASDPMVPGVSHIVVDEVHERSMEIDFLLLILRNILPKRRDLKVVLMSATLNADVFSAYFSHAPCLSIPGRTFPVEQFFLLDVLEKTRYQPRGKLYMNRKQEEEEKLVAMVKQSNPGYSDHAYNAFVHLRQSALQIPLIQRLVWYIVENSDSGGILIFLPGALEITKLCDVLQQQVRDYQSNGKFWIVPLHGSLSADNQRKVFCKTPRGTRKIVVATNIAETSITVNDIVYVIDSCKMKETQYDPELKLAKLVETWVSKANGTQRQGRAGRVKSGFCYRVCSEQRWKSFPDHQLPEMHRVPLNHICLQIKLLSLQIPSSSSSPSQKQNGHVQAVLRDCIEPPQDESITSAISELTMLGALSKTELLTPLGHHLARLPISNVRIGKLLIYGSIFGCLESILSIAALMNGRSPFLSPQECRDEADAARLGFAQAKSDHMTLLNAFNQYKQIQDQQGRREADKFCSDNFLSRQTLREVEKLTKQFRDALKDIGFVDRNYRGSNNNNNNNNNNNSNETKNDYNANEGNFPVITAVLCAGLYPNVIRVRAPEELGQQTAHGAVTVQSQAKNFKYYVAQNGEQKRVFIHPRSVNFSTSSYESLWMVYLQLVQTSKFYIHDCTMVSPYALLLFGGQIETDSRNGLVSVDRWIKFRAVGRIAVLCRELRQHFDALLEEKIDSPNMNVLSGHEYPVVKAILRLITTNGF